MMATAPRDDRAVAHPLREAAPVGISTRATRLLGIRLPIVQGGLARVAFAELAAAVSNAGGLGQISTAGLGTPERLRAEIRCCRALTDQPFGVNFPIGRFDMTPLLETALEEGVQVVALTAGNPAPFIRRCEGTGARTLVLTAGPELARKAEAAGADLVATVGYEGGGHIGRIQNDMDLSDAGYQEHLLAAPDAGAGSRSAVTPLAMK